MTTRQQSATPNDLDQLREWARLHAEANSQPWRLVCDLFAAYDLRGLQLVSLAERVHQQSDQLSRRAERTG